MKNAIPVEDRYHTSLSAKTVIELVKSYFEDNGFEFDIVKNKQKLDTIIYSLMQDWISRNKDPTEEIILKKIITIEEKLEKYDEINLPALSENTLDNLIYRSHNDCWSAYFLKLYNLEEISSLFINSFQELDKASRMFFMYSYFGYEYKNEIVSMILNQDDLKEKYSQCFTILKNKINDSILEILEKRLLKKGYNKKKFFLFN